MGRKLVELMTFCVVSVCKQGYYTAGIWCILCPKGTYSDQLGLPVSCKPCPASTSTLQPGATSMNQCLSVSPASILSPLGPCIE